MRTLSATGLAGLVAYSIISTLFDPLAAQEPMMLPTVDEVPVGTPTPIDGLWSIDNNGDHYRIEKGRAYAVDETVTLGIAKIKPNSIMATDIERVAAGTYSGYDLSLLGRWSAKLLTNRTLVVFVDGTLATMTYSLTALQIDDEQAFAQEMDEVRNNAPGAMRADDVDAD